MWKIKKASTMSASMDLKKREPDSGTINGGSNRDKKTIIHRQPEESQRRDGKSK